ncbi:PAS domain-containing protein [Algoriphagus aestuarii]|nr:PAS domain-containing protein [Algoriphagus aestuarii]
MEFILNPYSSILLISGLLVGGLSTFIALRLGDSTRWIALTMLCVSIWGIFYGLELTSSTKEMMLFFVKIEYIGILLTPAFWLIFCLKYTGLKPKKLNLTFLLLGVIPVLSYLILLTNDSHHFHYASTSVINTMGFPTLKIEIGPWYLVNIVYSYSTFLIGLVLLGKRFKSADPLYKKQTLFLFLAGIIPILINALYQLGLFNGLSAIDFTPFAFLFTYLLLAFAIIRYSLFSIKPIAKDIIIETITRGVLVVDHRMNILDYNAAFLNFFIQPKSVQIGKNLVSLFQGFPEIIILVQSKAHQTIEVQDNIDGNRKIIRIEAIPILDPESLLSGSVLLFEDISEEILNKETLEKQTEELKQLNDLKDKYFSIISHDLKGPIFGVKELIHLTQSGLISQEEFMEMMPEISKNMENVAILLENLLAWTSSQLRGEFVQKTTFDIISLINQQKSLLERITHEKKLKIQVEDSSEKFVYADRNMVELVIRNLLSNAIKFSVFQGVINITVSEEKENVKICIEDNGAGISEENLEKLKNGISFTTKGKHNESGTGLGLILVQDYLQKNNATLEVESEINKGSKFCVFIPKATSGKTD